MSDSAHSEEPVVLNNISVSKLLDVLAYAYVRGWYDGCDGAASDDGKAEVAREQLHKLLHE